MRAAARYYRRKALRREERTSEFDASPVADLAFLLLIFFIVTSSFILRQGVFLSLPSKKASAVQVRPEQIFRITPGEVNYQFEGATWKRGSLLRELKARVDKIEKPVVLVYMDQALPYERLVDSLSLAREAGVRKISIREEGRR